MRMMVKCRTLVAIFSSCTILFLILVSYGYMQSPTTYSWHLLQKPLQTVDQSNSNPLLSQHLRRIEVPIIDKEILMFDKQNVTSILANTKLLLESFYSAIEKAAKELKSNRSKGWVDHGETRRFIDAYNKEYFNQVRTLPSVRTVFANTDFDNFKKILKMRHYNYGSSDCIALEKNGIYGNNWGHSVFNETCQSDVSKYTDSKPVVPNYLTIGLPNGFSLSQPEVALTFMHVISNAIVSHQGDVFVDQTKLVIQRCSQSKSTSGRPNPQNTALFDEVFTIAQYWGSGFFHFTAENLIRIAPYLEFLREKKQIKVHVVNAKSFTQTWLGKLGINKARLVSGPVRASILYAPAGGTCGRPAYLPSNLLSMNLRQSFGLTKGPRDQVVVIKRSSLRFFRQHDKIWQMVKQVAEPLGFQVKLFGDKPVPTLEETKEMFQRAVLVVGPHGAGLSNMFLSQPGTVILEGLCSPVNLCYRNMAMMLGHRYVGLLFNKKCFDYTPDDIKPYLQYFLQHINQR